MVKIGVIRRPIGNRTIDGIFRKKYATVGAIYADEDFDYRGRLEIKLDAGALTDEKHFEVRYLKKGDL